MKTLRMAAAILCGLGLMAAETQARGPAGLAGNNASSELFAKLFGKNLAFTATGHMTTTMSSTSKPIVMDMDYAFLDGNVRVDMDTTKIQGTAMDAGSMASLKQMGMDRVVTLVLSEKKQGYMIYPNLKSYCDLPMDKAGADGKEPKIDKTDMGKETIEGHPCTKSKVTMTDADGKTTESILWQATDMKDFPIQMQVQADANTTVLTTFKNINQTKPAASLFDVPGDYQHYASIQEMMMQAAQKMMGGFGH